MAGLAIFGFLFLSLTAGAFSSAQIEADVHGEDPPDVPRYLGMIRISYDSQDYFVSIEYQGTADFTAVKDFYKAEMPNYGWALTYEYSNEDSVSLSFVKEGAYASIWIYTYDGETFVSVYYSSPQLPTQPTAPEVSIPENFSLSLLLEFKSTGRCAMRADYAGTNPLLYYVTYRAWTSPPSPAPSPGGLEGETSFEAGPIPSGFGPILAAAVNPVSWDINIELTSPSAETLTVTASGWAILPLTAEQKQMVSMAVASYKLAPAMFNQLMLQYIQNQLRYTSGISITNLNITQLDWDDAASKLTFGATVTASSTMFGEPLRKELPATITTTGSGSIPTKITSIEDLEGLTLDVLLRAVTKTAVAELQVNFAGINSTIGFRFEFELRTDDMGVVTRTENVVVVDFSALHGYFPIPVQIPVQDLPQFENVSFTLKVPSGAEVMNLPDGYTATDFTYTWTGSSAVNAMLALITGKAGTRISYWVGPAFVTVENIQEYVGQTIVVKENYVENVTIESEKIFIVNFEKDQPFKRAKVFLTAPVVVSVQAQRLPEKPPEVVVEPPAEKGMVFCYLEIKTAAPEQVVNATLEFQVPQLWISVNNIDKASIRLLRYQDGQWVELDTTKLTEDENYVYYSAETLGFSFFAITGTQLLIQPLVEPPSIWVIVVTAIALVAVLIAVVWRYLSRGG